MWTDVANGLAAPGLASCTRRRNCSSTNGYVATTIEAIAERAEVANQTVYYVFGTKAEVLTAVLEGSIVGDLDPVALADREWVETLADVEDAAAAVERLVAESVQVLVRVAPIYRVLQHAAADPDVGGLLEETRRRRRLDQRRLIDVGVAQWGTSTRPRCRTPPPTCTTR